MMKKMNHSKHNTEKGLEDLPSCGKTLYASALVTVNEKGYTKHYFEEGKRICSKIGSGELKNVFDPVPKIEKSYEEQRDIQVDGIHTTYSQCMNISPYIKNRNLYETIIKKYTNQINSSEPAFYYHSDHLGSASFLTDETGKETQHLVYLPFGEDWVDKKYNNPKFQTPYKFNGKEKDTETGYNYYGARYYYDWASIFLSVDPMSEELPDVSTYAYCLNNPIKLIDPDGEFPVWAIVGAVVDYGFQVHDNYKKGSSGYDAWIGDVDFVDVGLSAVNPTGKFKIAKTLVVEASKAAIDYTKNDGVKVDTDVKKVAKKAAVNTVVEVGAQKLTNAGSKKAMQNANKEANVANKRLKSLEVQAQRSPNSTKKAGNVNTAQSNAQAARNKQVRTKMLNSTVGKAPEATQHVIKTAVNRTQKDE